MWTWQGIWSCISNLTWTQKSEVRQENRKLRLPCMERLCISCNTCRSTTGWRRDTGSKLKYFLNSREVQLLRVEGCGGNQWDKMFTSSSCWEFTDKLWVSADHRPHKREAKPIIMIYHSGVNISKSSHCSTWYSSNRVFRLVCWQSGPAVLAHSLALMASSLLVGTWRVAIGEDSDYKQAPRRSEDEGSIY